MTSFGGKIIHLLKIPETINMKEEKADWIFFLNLSDKLNPNFLDLDEEFKKKNYTLIPMGFKAFLDLNKESEKINVICLVTNIQEKERFIKKVRKLMAYMLRYDNINFYIVSGFSSLNETALYKGKGNYHFTQLPVRIVDFCDDIVGRIEARMTNKHKWPGGKRPRMGLHEVI